MDARRHSALLNITQYTQTRSKCRLQRADSPQLLHSLITPAIPPSPPCPVLIFNLSINTVPSVDSVNSLDTTPLSQ